MHFVMFIMAWTRMRNCGGLLSLKIDGSCSACQIWLLKIFADWPNDRSNRKRELLSREDLELPWRPLYELQERILYSKTEHLGLNWFPK